MPSRLALLVVCLLLGGACSQGEVTAPAAASPGLYTGSLGGADYRIGLPQHWNGTLLLYSHGYAAPDGGNPASDTPLSERHSISCAPGAAVLPYGRVYNAPTSHFTPHPSPRKARASGLSSFG